MYYTVAAFEEVPWLQSIIVPVSEDHIESLTKTAAEVWAFKKVKFVLGSSTRHRSIAAGVTYLSALPASEQPDVVIVHDIVRPFVEEPLLRKVSQAAFDHGASGAFLPLVSTVIAVDAEGFLDHALDRNKYLASHTPQACRMVDIVNAYSKCTDYDFDFGTEVLHLVQTYSGSRVKMVEGDPNIWKITYKPDLYAAQQMVKERLRHVAIVTGGSRGIGKAVVRGLRDRGTAVIAVARTEGDLVIAAKETGCDTFVADVSKPADVHKLFQYATEKYKHVDVLINNAGNAVLSSIAEMVCVLSRVPPPPHSPQTDAQWEEIIQTNLSSTFYCCREALRSMCLRYDAPRLIHTQACSWASAAASLSTLGPARWRADDPCRARTRPARPASRASPRPWRSKASPLVCVLVLCSSTHSTTPAISAYCVVPRRTNTDLRYRLFPNEVCAAHCWTAAHPGRIRPWPSRWALLRT